jgi:hypothetical protein
MVQALHYVWKTIKKAFTLVPIYVYRVMMTGYYMMVSIWFALSANAGNKKGDFITCTQNLSVMVVIVRPSSYGLSS